MKLRKGWKITTPHKDELTILDDQYSKGTVQWAKRHNYEIKRVFILSN